MEELLAQQVLVVRLGVRGPPILRGGRLDQFELERSHHRPRDLVLQHEDVGHLPVVGLRPEVIAIGGVDELGGDADLIASLAHAPLQNRLHVQLLGDCADVLVLALEGKGRSARGDAQARHLGEEIEELLGETVGEVFLLLVRAEVHQREHRDRRAGLRRLRRRGTVAHHQVVDQARRGRERPDADEQEREAGAERLAGGLLDTALLDVEDPGQPHHHRKAGRQRHHHVGEHSVRPAQAVHHRLDDLQHREGGDAVSDQRAEDAPPLQLGQQGR